VQRALVLLALAACGRLGFDNTVQPQYLFVDDTQVAFDRGTYDTGVVPLVWRDGRVELAPAAPFTRNDVGVYLSRIFDTNDPTATWQTLGYTSPWPQRPLPDNEGTETGYAEASLRMVNNILLLHYEGTGDTVHGDQVPDASGRLHHGQIVHAGEGARYRPGLFGNALDKDRDSWVRLDGGYFDYGTGGFTYATWVKLFDCTRSRSHREVIGGAGTGDTPHMWIGVLCPDSCTGRDGVFMNWLDNTRMGGTVSTCSGAVLDDGNWHLIVGTKEGHASPSATLRVYVDGKLAGSTTYNYGGGSFTYDAGEIRIGSFNLNDPEYNAPMVVDETAIWKRTLDVEEIEALFRRGAVRTELQFRACDDPACDGEPFVGPDGTTATYFVSDGEHDIAGLGLAGRYAQYRARLSTAMPMVSPQLLAVTASSRKP
jgi:Concanavalin A-like lectin/glucanases superfamily